MYDLISTVEPGCTFLTDTEEIQMMLPHTNGKIVKEGRDLPCNFYQKVHVLFVLSVMYVQHVNHSYTFIVL